MGNLKSSSLLFLISFLFVISPLFAQQMDWTIATDSAQWIARGAHTSVVFENKIWVIGGTSSLGFRNDVWFSSDGIDWTQATSSAPWSERLGHTSGVFDNKIWVIGGYNYSFRNDVWFSEDGTNWTQATASAPWAGRCYHTSAVFDNKIWVIGGFNGSELNDVWYSTDGINWTIATDSAAWEGRDGHSSVVFDNKIWVMGGTNYDMGDIWYSADGINWIQTTGQSGWSRYYFASVVFDNKIWIMGGDEYDENDVWYSADGINWNCATTSAGWTSRYDLTSVVFNDKIWVIGGIDAIGHTNDVWFSRGATILSSPNGGETLFGGYHTYIKWQNLGSRSGFARYRLLLSKNGYTYNDTISSNISPFDTMYYWFIPYFDFVTGRIKIQVLDTSSLIIREDASDGFISIQTYIYIRYPSYDDSLPGGSYQTISWFTYGTDFNRYRILFSRNRGVSYPDTIAHNIAPTETTYSWLVPYINSVGCRIKIQKIDNFNRVVNERESQYFKIYSPIWLASDQYPMFRYDLQHTGRSPYGAGDPLVTWFYSTSQLIISSPIIAPDCTVFFVSENDSFYALNSDGSKRWVYYLGQSSQSTPALASDNTIYIGDNYGNLICFPYNISAPYWRYCTGGPILSSPAIGINGVIYVGSADGYLYAINPDSTLRWRFNVGSAVYSSPAIAQNHKIYVGSINSKLYAINPDGTRSWEIIFPAAILSSPAIGEYGTIYIGCCNGMLYAVDGSGMVKWSYQTGDSIVSSAAIGLNGTIYFGSCDGYVYALEDVGNQANLIWRFQTQGKVRSSPSVSSNFIIFIGSDDGNIYAIHSDGSLFWTRMTGNAVCSSPAIGADGTIYIGSDDGRLYAIGYAPGIKEEEIVNLETPKSFILYSGQPNPFALKTLIKFGLPQTRSVKLNIYSSSGVLLKTLVSETRNQGYHNVIWNGCDNFGRRLPAGIYFCRLETEGKQEIKKIVKLE